MKGEFSFSETEKWELYTDASGLATGVVLQIGQVYVEDASKLRGVKDWRHINLAELEAAIRGLLLVAKYFEALKYNRERDANGQVAKQRSLKLFVDSRVVCSWLTRSGGVHWVQVRGLNQVVVEEQLRLFWQTAKAMNLEIEVEYVRSGANKADALTRVPDVLMIRTEIPRNPKLQSAVLAKRSDGVKETLDDDPLGVLGGSSDELYNLTTVAGVERPRDEFGRVIVQSVEELRELLRILHQHEGVEALRKRVREMVSSRSLESCGGCSEVDKEVAEHVRRCGACHQAKPLSPLVRQQGLGRKRTVGPTEESGRSPFAEIPVGKFPFQVVHMDVTTVVSNLSSTPLHVVTLECSYSRFLLTACVERSVNSSDVAALLKQVWVLHYTVPMVVVSDSGREFMGEFAKACLQLKVRHVLTTPYNHEENGLVERVHGTLKSRIRALMLDKENSLGIRHVREAVGAATRSYNTSWHRAIARTPASVIFTYPSWVYPQIPDYRPDVEKDLFPVLEKFKEQSAAEGDGVRPEPGESWYVENRKSQLSAMDPRRVVVNLLSRYDAKSFWAMLGSTLTKVSVKHLTERVVEPLPRTAATPESVRPDEVAETPGGLEADTPPDQEMQEPRRPERVAKGEALKRIRQGR